MKELLEKIEKRISVSIHEIVQEELFKYSLGNYVKDNTDKNKIASPIEEYMIEYDLKDLEIYSVELT
jgi:hypothetical protein